LDNQVSTDAAVRPGVSVCADIARQQEPTLGTVVHEARATLSGQGGVVLVFMRPDGSGEVRLYATGDADPLTGGCSMMLQVPLSR
jgi:hypothetical protein